MSTLASAPPATLAEARHQPTTYLLEAALSHNLAIVPGEANAHDAMHALSLVAR